MDLNNPTVGYPIIMDLLFFHNDLVVVGNFNYAGNISANNIAKWTGVNWCSYGGQFDQSILCVENWKDTLYIGGSFSMINSEPYGFIARWEGSDFSEECSTPILVSENHIQNKWVKPISLGNGLWFIQMDAYKAEGAKLDIYDMSGRRQKIRYTNNKEGFIMNIGALASGIYMLQIIDKTGLTCCAKLIEP
jgi:hypothetical protein